MQALVHAANTFPNTGRIIRPFAIAIVLSLLCYTTYNHFQQRPKDRVNMEKSSGKNGKHANEKARESADEQYQEAKDAWQQMKAKPNKSPQDKQLQQQLEKQVKHLEKKKNWKGEHHSQKHKGN